jgi:hypothetical protein
VARSPPARKKKGGATEIGRVLRPAAEAGWRSEKPEGENRAGGGTNARYRVLYILIVNQSIKVAYAIKYQSSYVSDVPTGVYIVQSHKRCYSA